MLHHKPPVHRQIQHELESRNKQCKARDPNDEYKYPSSNPYELGSVEVLKKKYPFKNIVSI